MKKIPGLLIQPKNLFFIFIAVAVLAISSALIELRQSREEMSELLRQESHRLLETLMIASSNAIQTHQEYENQLRERLLNNLHFIKNLYEKKQISNSFLSEIANQNNIYRINIFDRNGKKIFYSFEDVHEYNNEKRNPKKTLQPLFDGEKDTMIVGIREARHVEGSRYIIGLRAGDGSVIAINLDAEEILALRKKVGFGSLLQQLVQDANVQYLAIQNVDGILAAAGDVKEFTGFETDSVLHSVYSDNAFYWRTISIESTEYFEALHSFQIDGIPVGVFRLGLSLKPLEDINSRIVRRIIIIAILLTIFGTFIILFIFVRQNYDVLRKQYRKVEEYSQTIIEHANDAIIVTDKEQKIVSFNKAALELFSTNNSEFTNSELQQHFESACAEILAYEESLVEKSCSVGNEVKTLLISKSTFINEKEETNTIFIIKDLTDIKNLEQKLKRKEKLVAMGELASGVAHEIRNPLNTIGTIVQQLRKDFTTNNDQEEYKNLTALVYKEVKRINETVQDFLTFSRPVPINPESFNLKTFFEQVHAQFSGMFKENKIEAEFEILYTGEVYWDKKRMQQVFLNLLQNAVDAIEKNGKISCTVIEKTSGIIEVKISDTGYGIKEEHLQKVFNLYFTTKANGTGIGLGIVQRIIDEHNGDILVESKLREGTDFTITLPKTIEA